ncbi:MarR family winged helix-turn-helix transcriptional regulator [Methylobacterium indicum]|uniref:MarR family winged helix-turn-helix transcriptional regulator n=1 Tax=Methylobacterium indicum TaxID=1775910 RepID=UPI0009E4C62D|nr:MarR family winged helix-turn-helix transcriptional regulator [Methylobacterium indicum]
MHELLSNKLGALGALIEERTTHAFGDLSPSAAAVLSTLHFRSEMTTTELSKIVGVSQPTAVRLLDGLQRRGLVERGEQAGRYTPLSLTDAGRMEVVRLQCERISSIGSLLAILGPDEIGEFEGILDRILAAATTSRASARTTCRLCEHDLCGPGICPIGNKATVIEQEGFKA